MAPKMGWVVLTVGPCACAVPGRVAVVASATRDNHKARGILGCIVRQANAAAAGRKNPLRRPGPMNPAAGASPALRQAVTDFCESRDLRGGAGRLQLPTRGATHPCPCAKPA